MSERHFGRFPCAVRDTGRMRWTAARVHVGQLMMSTTQSMLLVPGGFRISGWGACCKRALFEHGYNPCADMYCSSNAFDAHWSFFVRGRVNTTSGEARRSSMSTVLSLLYEYGMIYAKYVSNIWEPIPFGRSNRSTATARIDDQSTGRLDLWFVVCHDTPRRPTRQK